MNTKRRPVIILFLVTVMLLSVSLVASGAATTKALSTNFTLVNLNNGANTVSINYYKPDGSAWRPAESEVMSSLGSQLIRAQYFDDQLTAGAGSVVVGGSGPMGAVVQIQARNQTPTTRAAYSGATAGAQTANAPYMAKKLTTASGVANGQVIVQNTGGSNTTFTIELINSSGAVVRTTPAQSLNPGASYTYDLSDDGSVPDSFFGSAVVKAAAGGQVAVVANMFSGADTLQTYNAFTSQGKVWLAPLFTSRLANTLSTVVAVQNISGAQIPVGGIAMSCTKDPASPGANFNASNTTAVGDKATYFFNPVSDTTTFPTAWYGSCRVETTGDTVAFVQMRVVSGAQSGAYEAIKGDGAKKGVVVPLYAKRLGNGFATVTTVQNLNKDAAANVTLQYIKSASANPPLPDTCNATITAVIDPGASLQQNLRVASGAGSVPQITDGCYGTIVVTSSNQPIDAIVQLTDISGLAGDTFQVHNAFTYDPATAQ